MINQKVTCCGVDCSTCPHFGTGCQGCDKECGKVYWVTYLGTDVCPIYRCVEEKGLSHCGECAELPCKTWADLKYPNRTEEQHRVSIRVRLETLRNR